MAFDRHFYGDPAQHVKFERETNRCFGCKHISKLLGMEFCGKGFDMAKRKKVGKCQFHSGRA